jgi:hypothetical protein
MEWQARVRQAFKRKDIEIALLEFSLHQQKKTENYEENTEQKLKTSKPKIKKDGDTKLIAGLSEGSSEEM